ncbi:hypothetical protein ABNF97_01245 [Plantactinospora sp. B6F1]|uniref:hypothetical protein n=1 Tax=Plantactinospora sp. B6F1 TaxID=3158971 RepID=UPI0032D8B7AA
MNGSTAAGLNPSLPWSGTGTFRLRSYDAAHSRLVLTSRSGRDPSEHVEVVFAGVESLQVQRRYAGLTVALAAEPLLMVHHPAGPLTLRLLRVALSSPSGTGLVTCSWVSVLRRRRPEDGELFETGVLASCGVSAYGGSVVRGPDPEVTGQGGADAAEHGDQSAVADRGAGEVADRGAGERAARRLDDREAGLAPGEPA